MPAIIECSEPAQLPVSHHVARELGVLAGQDRIAGVLVDSKADPVRVHAWGAGCVDKTEEKALAAFPQATHVWRHLRGRARPGSRTYAALTMLAADPRLTPFAAAREAGVNVAAVYRAMQRTTCPCCGRAGSSSGAQA